MEKSKDELLLHITHLEAIIDSLPFDVWMKDKEGKYLIVNKNVSADIGLPREDIIGKNDYDLYEKSVFDPSGELLGTAGYSKDITLKEKIRGELAQSEERFRTIFEEAPLGIGIFDTATGKATQVNARYAEILGRTKEEVLDMDWKQYSHPDEIEENVHRIDLLIENKVSGFSMDKRYIRPDGEEVWVNITVTPFHSTEYEDHCHLCMIEDITARKKAEEEIVYLS